MSSMSATFTVDFKRGRPVAKRPVEAAPAGAAPVTAAQVPRVARLLALAHRIERAVREGELADYADAARLGYVTRARVSQVVGLLNLAPDIQEELLFSVQEGGSTRERDVRSIASDVSWRRQRASMRQLATLVT